MFGFFKAIVGGIGAIFSPHTNQAAIDVAAYGAKMAIDGMDHMKYTDEERVVDGHKINEVVLRITEATAGENTTKSLTRRYLAVMIMGSFLGLVVMSGIVFSFNPEWAKYLLDCAKMLSGMAMTVTICFYGYYGITKIIESKTGNGTEAK